MADLSSIIAGLFGAPAQPQRPSQQQMADALRGAYFKKTLDHPHTQLGWEYNDQPTPDQQVRSLFANPANIGTFKKLESDMEGKLTQPWWNIAPYQDPKGI